MPPKWICIVRHAQSEAQNTDVKEKLASPNGKLPKRSLRRRSNDLSLLDAPLSVKGIKQSEKRAKKPPKVDLVVTSPLTRALETSLILFENPPHIPIVVSPLMSEIPKSKNMKGFENVGRRLEKLKMDERLNSRKRFRSVDFSLLRTYEETYPNGPTWWHHNYNPKQARLMMHEFEKWLYTRPERVICLVGHCCWLMKFCRTYNRIPNAVPIYFPAKVRNDDNTVRISRRYGLGLKFWILLRRKPPKNRKNGKVAPNFDQNVNMLHDSLIYFIQNAGNNGVNSTQLHDRFGSECLNNGIGNVEFQNILNTVAIFDNYNKVWKLQR